MSGCPWHDPLILSGSPWHYPLILSLSKDGSTLGE